MYNSWYENWFVFRCFYLLPFGLLIYYTILYHILHITKQTEFVMQINLYNTMSRKVEEFKPLIPGQVGFYSCGPTVYHHAHIGNMRTMIMNDILKRMFLANGYKVRHIMNITDVGHLTNEEEDSGEDKMEKGAAREGKSVWDIAKFYTDAFLRDSKDLNILPPTEMPRATDYIQEQIELVKKLEELGYTYEIPDDGIYYDTAKFANYGALTGGSISGNRAGARVAFSDAKRNPSDFALWKFSPKGSKRAMEWDSPWGVGFPGWAIECSAMSMKLLGNHFDIHTGGEDLSRTHHANEIAQSEPITGKPWVNYWMHGSFLLDKSGEKMAKSAGEFMSLDALRKRGYDPMAYRYLILLGHYQSQLAFSWEALDAAAAGYKNIVRKVAGLLESTGSSVPPPLGGGSGRSPVGGATLWHDRILTAVSDNMKTAVALTEFQEMLKDDSLTPAEKLEVVRFVDDLLGLQFTDRAEKLLATESAPIPMEIQKLADERMTAKAAKDWARADALRAEIESAGWRIEDSKDGMKLVINH
jgi:cysteinyl-tRNA synthetase